MVVFSCYINFTIYLSKDPKYVCFNISLIIKEKYIPVAASTSAAPRSGSGSPLGSKIVWKGYFDQYKTKAKAEGGKVFPHAKTIYLCGLNDKIIFIFLLV